MRYLPTREYTYFGIAENIAAISSGDIPFRASITSSFLSLGFSTVPKRLMWALSVFCVLKLSLYRLVVEGSAPAGVGVAEHLAGGTVEFFACFGGGD